VGCALAARLLLLPTASTEISEYLASGKRWVEQNSMHLSSLDVETMTRLRKFFTEGKPYATGRSYWSSSLVPFFNWLHDTRKVAHSLLAGQPKLPRDQEGERPDPRRIPDPRQLREIAATMGESHGLVWETFVLLTGYCALRISEALDVRLDSFEKRNGRWWLNVATQEHRAVAACSDTGATKERMRTKSTRRRTPAPRLVPIPNQLLERLETHYGSTLGQPTFDCSSVLVAAWPMPQRFESGGTALLPSCLRITPDWPA